MISGQKSIDKHLIQVWLHNDMFPNREEKTAINIVASKAVGPDIYS